MDSKFDLQPKCLLKIPIGASPKRGSPDRSTPQRIYSSPQRNLSPRGSASPGRSEPGSFPRNTIFMGSYPPTSSFDPEPRDQSNLIMLCHDKATQTYFITFVTTVYATEWGTVPAPLFEMYTLHLHDNYLVYKLGSISKFQHRCRASKSTLGITIHAIAKLASGYVPTTDILAPQIFSLDLNLADPKEALFRIYTNQVLLYRDPNLKEISAAADLRLFHTFVDDVDRAQKYHQRIKASVMAQIRDAWTLLKPEVPSKDPTF